MSTPQFEAFLAKLYTDEAFRSRFLADRWGVATAAGLTEVQIQSLVNVDAEGLSLAAHGFDKKREKSGRKQSWLRR
jgi:hypothetical protein